MTPGDLRGCTGSELLILRRLYTMRREEAARSRTDVDLDPDHPYTPKGNTP